MKNKMKIETCFYSKNYVAHIQFAECGWHMDHIIPACDALDYDLPTTAKDCGRCKCWEPKKDVKQ